MHVLSLKIVSVSLVMEGGGIPVSALDLGMSDFRPLPTNKSAPVVAGPSFDQINLDYGFGSHSTLA